MGPPGAAQISVEGRQLRLTNLDKVLYPAAAFTKAEVIDYYTRIAPVLLPHLRQRPLTLKRYPDGVDAGHFFEKQCPAHRPPWVQTAPVWSGSNDRTVDYCLADDLPTLVWVANLAALELHPSLSQASRLDCPTMVVFDLDPGPPAGILECARVAVAVRQVLGDLGLDSRLKSSGSKGLQLYVPLNTSTTYEETKPFAHAIARLLERQLPDLVVSRMTKELRRGKVLIDWSQNDEHKTTVAVYSLRAMASPTVSAPLQWEEVEGSAADGTPLSPLDAGEVLERVKRHGDLFAPVLELRQRLPRFPAG